jgi:hypothetical protein
VERTLLSAAFDVDFDLDLAFALRLSSCGSGVARRASDSRRRARPKFAEENVARVPMRFHLRIAHLITRNATTNGHSQKRQAMTMVSHLPCRRAASIALFYSDGDGQFAMSVIRLITTVRKEWAEGKSRPGTERPLVLPFLAIFVRRLLVFSSHGLHRGPYWGYR